MDDSINGPWTRGKSSGKKWIHILSLKTREFEKIEESTVKKLKHKINKEIIL